MDALGIALGHQQALAIGRVGLREQHLGAAIWADGHFSGNHVEPVGLQARDKGGEVGGDPLDLLDPKLFHQGLGDVRSGTEGLAGGVDIAIGNFIGHRDTDGARFLDLCERCSADGR